MNDFTQSATYATISTAMIVCATTAPGRAGSVPPAHLASLTAPPTDPAKPTMPTSTAACMMCMRSPGLACATAPRIASTTPKIAGISAVQLSIPLAT
jgi:hypothetical protein